MRYSGAHVYFNLQLAQKFIFFQRKWLISEEDQNHPCLIRHLKLFSFAQINVNNFDDVMVVSKVYEARDDSLRYYCSVLIRIFHSNQLKKSNAKIITLRRIKIMTIRIGNWSISKKSIFCIIQAKVSLYMH